MAKEFARRDQDEARRNREEPRDAGLAPLPAEIKLGPVDMSYGLFEGGFTLKNPNDVPIKDVGIVCEVEAPSGTVIHHYRFTIFEIVPAKGEKVIKNYKFGFWPQQGKRVGCRVQRV